MYVRTLPARFAPGLFLCLALLWSGCDEGVLELDESGELVVEDVRAGTGEEAATGKRLMVHAAAQVRNGALFLDTKENNQPLVFILGNNEVIPGLEQGLPGMKEGGLRRLTIPPRLAFGTNSSDFVPPNSTVIFDIELLRVDHADSLAIEDIKQGDGALAAAGDTLTVHYNGYLGNGYIFDTTTDNGVPIRFIVGTGAVIAGWDQGLVNMREGGVRRLIIPPRLGYGDRGRGVIPPNATLLFDIQIVRVAKGP